MSHNIENEEMDTGNDKKDHSNNEDQHTNISSFLSVGDNTIIFILEEHRNAIKSFSNTNINDGVDRINNNHNNVEDDLNNENNCHEFRTAVNSCYAISDYVSYLKYASDEVNKDMIHQLALFDSTHAKQQSYFFSCLKNKSLIYMVHKSLCQSDHQEHHRINSNVIYFLLQTKLCSSLTMTEKSYYANIIHNLLAHPEQQQNPNQANNLCSNTNCELATTLILGSHNSNINQSLYGTSTTSDVCTNLLEGKNSIPHNLPTLTPVYDQKSGHIFIPNKKTIIIMFALENLPVLFLSLDGCVYAKTDRVKPFFRLLPGSTESVPNNCFFS